MARPRYQAGEQRAQEKLSDAFWRLLADRPYSRISVLDVVREAGVNKNTFYYHFADIDELAQDAVEHTLDPEALFTALSALSRPAHGVALSVAPALEARLDRLCLIAGSHTSPALRHLLKDALRGAWSQILHLNEAQLTLERQIAIEFALGGILEVMAFRNSTGHSLDFATTSKTMVESGMFAAFLRSTGASWDDRAPGPPTQTSDVRAVST